MQKYPASHITLLGSPWTEATGIALTAGLNSDDPRNLAQTSASAEMAMKPLRKITEKIRDFHAEIAKIHPLLEPVQIEMQLAIDAFKRAEIAYESWRQRTRRL